MKPLFLLPLLGALLACRPVGTDYTRPKLALPASFGQPAGGTAPQVQWWTALGDPQLTALIGQAFAQSPDLRIAEARLRQARALQGVQDAQGGPSVNLDGRVSRDRLSANGEQFANLPFQNPQVDFTNYQVGFDASWELDFFGHQRRLSEAAQARTGASAERLDDARLMLAGEVARNYIELRTWQQRLVLAEAVGRDLDDLVRLTRIARQAGDVAELDLQQAEWNRSSFQATVPALHTGLRENLTALGTLTGLSFDAVQAQVGAAAPALAVPQAPASGLPSDLINRRPDLRAAERDLAAANADVSVSVAELYPRFSLVGNAGWNAVQSGSLLQNASRTWSLGPQFTLPIFNHGLLKQQVRANQAAFDAALGTYHKAVLSALADVDVAFTRMARSEQQRGQLLTAEQQQQRIVALTERQFQAGEVARTALLQAHRSLLNQQDQAVQAQSQSLAALVAIYKALGGGWAQ
jgi:NodT family efflux transporter outer membrane factor (OMF) lipoprotein